MNNIAARLCVALLAAGAATAPGLALAAKTLQNPGGESLAEQQSAFLRVPLEDTFGLAPYETQVHAIGTPDGRWTLVEDMPARRNADGSTRRHTGDDVVISLAPGSYLLRGMCYGNAEHAFDAQPLEVVAGREYVVNCRSRDHSDLRITDYAGLPPKAVRPVRTAWVDVPAGVPGERIAEAVKAALAHRGWELAEEQAGQLDALHRDKRDSTRIRIQYDPREVRFDFLEGKTDVEDGEAAAYFSYYFRIRLLGQDIGKHLAGQPLTD